MKQKILLFLISLLLTGCFAHWETPSENLATQANNYLTNERDYFFYQACFLYGEALRCLNKHNSMENCKTPQQNAMIFLRSNNDKAKRFISPNTADPSDVANSQRRLNEIAKTRNESEFIIFMKEGLNKSITLWTEKEWKQCSAVAGI